MQTGRKLSTGRKIAIKKLKVGQFKGKPQVLLVHSLLLQLAKSMGLMAVNVSLDGLDMSAIREVKFLQELRHPNVIEVRLCPEHGDSLLFHPT